jgi:hypothetical protein
MIRHNIAQERQRLKVLGACITACVRLFFRTGMEPSRRQLAKNASNGSAGVFAHHTAQKLDCGEVSGEFAGARGWVEIEGGHSIALTGVGWR